VRGRSRCWKRTARRARWRWRKRSRAREAHIGWCAARNITHAGAVGYFALQAANAGMIGMVMSASGPMMAYHGEHQDTAG
jgi:LDH2 family malate/lactate/ureidoglycolate dehydrogenase